jgi:hypothetical protein
MRLTTTLALLTMGCQTDAALSPSEELSPAEALPPAPLVVPACAPGSAFELNGTAYPTLQPALDAAIQGDTIVACAGTHVIGDVYTYTMGITLAGETSDPADVTLTGGSVVLSVTLPQPPGATTLSGLTFLNTGVVAQASGFIAQDLVFLGAEASLSAETHDLGVYRTSFTGSEAWSALDVGPLDREITVTLDDVRFEDNRVGSSVLQIRNADLSAASGRVRMRDVDVINNVSNGVSTSVVDVSDDISVQIIGGEVSGNESPLGGIVRLDGLVGRSRISGWSVTDNEGGWETVSVLGRAGRLDLRDSAILRNRHLNAALGEGVALIHGVRTDLTNVDLGTGADTNLPADIAICGVDYGVIPSAAIPARAYCPR